MMKKLACGSLLAVMVLLQGGSPLDHPGCPTAWGGESGWKSDFDALCGQSDSFMNMSTAELRRALEKCDELKAEIEKLEATPRKVYLKRLQMCRNLLGYMIENRLKEEQK